MVVQHDRFNRTTLATTVIAAITSNQRLGALPGNVRLRKGEANLPRPSVVNVTQLRTVDRARLTQRIGALGRERILEILGGIGELLGLELPVDGA